MNTPTSDLQSNYFGIRFLRTEGARIDWSVRQDTQLRITRFEAFQQAITRPQAPSLGLLAVRMIGLDAVPVSAIAQLEATDVRPYTMGHQFSIEWSASDPSRLERRIICPFTLLAWPNTQPTDQPCSFTEQTRNRPVSLRGLRRSLRRWLALCLTYQDLERPLEELAQDQLCWIHEYSPAALFAHVAGVSVMAAAPRSCMARRETGLALVQDDGQLEVSDVGATTSIVQATIEAEGETFSEGLIRMAADVFRSEHRSGIDGHTKRQWAEALHELASRVRRAHPAVGVIIGWAAHQSEYGTVDTANPAARTVKRYSLRLMHPLAVGLRGFPVEVNEWKSERLIELYIDIIKNTAESSRSETSAAIASFNSYLEEWYDVAPLERSFGHWTPSKPPVRSNLLWQHEMDRCIELALRCEDERLGAIAVCCLWIARENAVRIQDLLRLRLVNVHPPVEGSQLPLEIEVVRDAGRGRLKTVDSQRRLYIRDQEAITCLVGWHNRRTSEAAPGKALLFGDRNDDRRVYRQAALHNYLNQLVKRATGDAEMRFHHFRHTGVSQRMQSALLTSSLVDANLLEILAADSGHSSPKTTLQVYSHLYEQPLRMWLDLGLSSSLKFGAEEARAIVGVKANTLVQTARRRGVSMTALVLDRVAQMSQNLSVETCCSIYSFGEPMSPKLSIGQPYQVTAVVVADVLLRQLEGQPVSKLAPLLNLNEDMFATWHRHLTQWLQACVQRLYPRKHLNNVPNDLRTLLSILNADVGRMFSERIPGLKEYLLTPVDVYLFQMAVASWTSCGRGEHIALVAGTNPRGLFQFLKAAGIPPAVVRLVVQREAFDFADELNRQPPQVAFVPSATLKNVHGSKAVEIFKQEFGLHPRLELREARIDRPKVYLQLTSKPSASVTPSAASTLSILKAWLVALQAYLLLPTAEVR